MNKLLSCMIHLVLLPSLAVCFHTSTTICSNRYYRTYLPMSRRSDYDSPSQDYPPPFRSSNYGNSYKRPINDFFDNSGGRFQNGNRDNYVNRDGGYPRGNDRVSDPQFHDNRVGGSTRRQSGMKEPYQSSSRQRRFDSIRAANTPPLPRRRDTPPLPRMDPPLQQYVRPNQQKYNSNNDLLIQQEQQRQRRPNSSMMDPMQRNDKDPLVRNKNDGNFYSNSQTRRNTRTTTSNNERAKFEPIPDPYKKFDNVQNKPSTGIDKSYLNRIESRNVEISNELLSRQKPQERQRRYNDRPNDEYLRNERDSSIPPVNNYRPSDERKQSEFSNPYTHFDNIDLPNDDPLQRMDERYVEDLESRLDSYRNQERSRNPERYGQSKYRNDEYGNDMDRYRYDDKSEIIDHDYDNPKVYVNGFENDFPSRLNTIEEKLQDFASNDSPNPYKRSSSYNNDEFAKARQEPQQQQRIRNPPGNDDDETYVRGNIPSTEKDEDYVRNLEARMAEMEKRLNAFLGKPIDPR